MVESFFILCVREEDSAGLVVWAQINAVILSDYFYPVMKPFYLDGGDQGVTECFDEFENDSIHMLWSVHHK